MQGTRCWICLTQSNETCQSFYIHYSVNFCSLSRAFLLIAAEELTVPSVNSECLFSYLYLVAFLLKALQVCQ